MAEASYDEYIGWKKELNKIKSKYENLSGRDKLNPHNAALGYEIIYLKDKIAIWENYHPNYSPPHPPDRYSYDIAGTGALGSPRRHGGKVKVYTGPKNGRYIIRNGSKVYIDRNSVSNNAQYKKIKPKKK